MILFTLQQASPAMITIYFFHTKLSLIDSHRHRPPKALTTSKTKFLRPAKPFNQTRDTISLNYIFTNKPSQKLDLKLWTNLLRLDHSPPTSQKLCYPIAKCWSKLSNRSKSTWPPVTNLKTFKNLKKPNLKNQTSKTIPRKPQRWDNNKTLESLPSCILIVRRAFHCQS